MSDIRPEFLHVLECMSETQATTPHELAEKVGSIHVVLLALSTFYYDGLIDITNYCRTKAGTDVVIKVKVQSLMADKSIALAENYKGGTLAADCPWLHGIEPAALQVSADQVRRRGTPGHATIVAVSSRDAT